MNVLSGLWKKLLDKKYRQSYRESYASMLVPFQIRALRKARGWTLKDLAERSGVSQKHLAYLEEAGAEPRTLKTLYKIATAFDVAISVEFVSFSTLVAREETFNPDRFYVAPFEEDTFNRTTEKKRDRKYPRPSSSAVWQIVYQQPENLDSFAHSPFPGPSKSTKHWHELLRAKGRKSLPDEESSTIYYFTYEHAKGVPSQWSDRLLTGQGTAP